MKCSDTLQWNDTSLFLPFGGLKSDSGALQDEDWVTLASGKIVTVPNKQICSRLPRLVMKLEHQKPIGWMANGNFKCCRLRFFLLLSVIIAQSAHYQIINTFTCLGQSEKKKKEKVIVFFTTDHLSRHQQISLTPTSCHSPLHWLEFCKHV